MKKIFVSFFLCLLFVSIFSKDVSGEEYSYTFDVNYKEDGKLETNFNSETISSILEDIQPGDTATVLFNVNNKNSSQAIDWWMDNQTLKTLEEDKENAEKAGYTYELVYKGSDNVNYTFFNSDIGGNINPNAGFSEATEGLEDYFKMQESSMKPGASGLLTLSITLDGESSGYYYQSNEGKLRLDFAVEIPVEPEPKTEEKHIPRIVYIPYTGDTINVNFYIALEMISLLLLAVITLAYFLYSRKHGGAR